MATAGFNISVLTPSPQDIMETTWWQVYGYLYQALIKFGPLFLIIGLNLAMVARLRRIWRRRRELKERMMTRSRPEASSTGTAWRTPETTATANCERDNSVLNSTNENPTAHTLGRRKRKRRRRRKKQVVVERPSSSIIATAENKEDSRRTGKKHGKDADHHQHHRELRMTTLLLSTAASHALLTIPGSVGFLFYTNFPDLWSDFDGRSLYNSVSNCLYAVKYSKNFFLYCATDADIRRATADLFRDSWRCLGRCLRCRCWRCAEACRCREVKKRRSKEREVTTETNPAWVVTVQETLG